MDSRYSEEGPSGSAFEPGRSLWIPVLARKGPLVPRLARKDPLNPHLSAKTGYSIVQYTPDERAYLQYEYIYSKLLIQIL